MRMSSGQICNVLKKRFSYCWFSLFLTFWKSTMCQKCTVSILRITAENVAIRIVVTKKLSYTCHNSHLSDKSSCTYICKENYVTYTHIKAQLKWPSMCLCSILYSHLQNFNSFMFLIVKISAWSNTFSWGPDRDIREKGRGIYLSWPEQSQLIGSQTHTV